MVENYFNTVHVMIHNHKWLRLSPKSCLSFRDLNTMKNNWKRISVAHGNSHLKSDSGHCLQGSNCIKTEWEVFMSQWTCPSGITNQLIWAQGRSSKAELSEGCLRWQNADLGIQATAWLASKLVGIRSRIMPQTWSCWGIVTSRFTLQWHTVVCSFLCCII